MQRAVARDSQDAHQLLRWYFSDFHPCCPRPPNHIRRPAPSGKRDDEIGPPFIEHALIADRAGSAAMRFPIGVIPFAVEITRLPPIPGHRVSTGRTAAHEGAHYRFQPVQFPIDSIPVLKVATAANQHSHCTIPFCGLDTPLPYQDGPSPPRKAAHHQEPGSVCRAGEHHQVSISAGAFVEPGPTGLHPTSHTWLVRPGTLWSLLNARGASIPAFTPQAMFKPVGRRLPVETIQFRSGTGEPIG